MGFGQAIGDLSSSIGRVVVDHHDPVLGAQRQHPREKCLQILALVISWNNHDDRAAGYIEASRSATGLAQCPARRPSSCDVVVSKRDCRAQVAQFLDQVLIAAGEVMDVRNDGFAFCHQPGQDDARSGADIDRLNASAM